MNPITQALAVSFHGAELFLVEHNDQPYTPMKPIVEGMGLDWASQFTKIKQRFATCIAEITMQLPGDSQRRSVICLPLRKLAGWLYTVNAGKVKPEIREKVIQYQNECDDALWDYWTKGHASRPTHSEPPAISKAHQGELYNRVAEIAGTNGKVRASIWSRFQNHFRIASYKHLPASRYEEALAYLGHIQGEYITNGENLPVPVAHILPIHARIALTLERGQVVESTLLPQDAVIMTPADLQNLWQGILNDNTRGIARVRLFCEAHSVTLPTAQA
jgi:hypothetical protein